MTLQENKKKNVWKVLFQVLNSDASAFLHMIKKGQNTHFLKPLTFMERMELARLESALWNHKPF